LDQVKAKIEGAKNNAQNYTNHIEYEHAYYGQEKCEAGKLGDEVR